MVVNPTRHAHALVSGAPPSPRGAPGLVVIVALVGALLSAGMCTAAIVAGAPAATVPLVVAVCIGCPLFAGWEAPAAVAALRAQRRRTKALAAWRGYLARLPETEHPLGL